VASARARAQELGRPRAAPPKPLEDCNRGQVESALAAPLAGWGSFELYPSLAAKAAALLCSFAKIQPCTEGNKRVTLIVVTAFLWENEMRLKLRPGQFKAMILKVANSDPGAREAMIKETTVWIERHMTNLDDQEAPS
jgi:death-on-curing protein